MRARLWILGVTLRTSVFLLIVLVLAGCSSHSKEKVSKSTAIAPTKTVKPFTLPPTPIMEKQPTGYVAVGDVAHVVVGSVVQSPHVSSMPTGEANRVSIADPLQADYPVKIDHVGIRFQRSRSNQITNTYLVMSFVAKNTSANPICEIMGTAWVQAPSQQRSQLGGYFTPLRPGKSHGFDVSLFLDEKDDPDVALLHTQPSQLHLHWTTERVKLCNGLVFGMGR